MGGVSFLGIVYLDNSSTTKPCKTAIEYMNKALCTDFANPSSLYGLGANAQIILDNTRQSVAQMLGCNQNEVYFTSCGTESNNTALFGAAHARKKRGNRIVSTKIEHPAVLNALFALKKEGFEVALVDPDRSGDVSEEAFLNAITKDTVLVSSMLVNNETGAVLPVEKIRDMVKAVDAPALIHCDASQAFGKMNVKVSSLGVDLLTASGHKIHAPKGIGILYKSKSAHIDPLLYGGGQEMGLRSGTEPVPAVAGLLGALEELKVIENKRKAEQLCTYAKAELAKLDYVKINSPDGALPNILNISVLGYRSETMLHFLEQKEIYVSSGSACSKGQKSHVLSAMGLDDKIIDSALRISFGSQNTCDDIDKLVAAIKEIPQRLRRA